jgi:hypothetical protein
MSDKFPISKIEKEVYKLGKEVKFSRKKGIVQYKGKKSKPIMITTSGIIYEDDAFKLAEELSRLGLGKKEDIYSNFTKKDYSTLTNYALISLSLGLILFTFTKANLTGAVIGISNNTLNIGVVVCLLGIIGLLIWKFRK